MLMASPVSDATHRITNPLLILCAPEWMPSEQWAVVIVRLFNRKHSWSRPSPASSEPRCQAFGSEHGYLRAAKPNPPDPREAVPTSDSAADVSEPDCNGIQALYLHLPQLPEQTRN